MGGFSQGSIEAGAKVVLAVDLWEEALKVHIHNHPSTPIIRMTLGTKNQFSLFIREIEKWRKLGYHVHLHGSPPCQALSNASSRDPSEGMPLVIWFLDLVKFTKPDSWSMENVVPMRKRLPEGTPSVVLNSADYGVAQTRRRCIAGEGWEAIPTHNKESWLSVIDALPHLKDELATHINLDGASDSNSRRAKSADFDINSTSGTLRNSKPSLRRLVIPIQRKVGVLKANGRILQPIWREIDEPIQTITTRSENIGIQVKDSELKPKKIRSLTIEETLTLQGFNSNYDMTQARTQKNRWTMIGNAVVPAVAKAIIGGIKQ
tara:strand:+ start:436 stop:1392 length:957 start_codon:yes stop_codon:yes gene_type:complete